MLITTPHSKIVAMKVGSGEISLARTHNPGLLTAMSTSLPKTFVPSSTDIAWCLKNPDVGKWGYSSPAPTRVTPNHLTGA